MTTGTKTSQSSVSALFVKRMVMLLALALVCMFGLAIFVPGPIQKNAYMGAEYCGSCHQGEYKSWLTSAHAKASEDLPEEHKNNLACLSCHATGVLERNEPFFKGVQCEACHGPGQHYASVHVKKDPVLSKLLFMQKPNEESCRHCHSGAANLWSPHHAMKKIDHWSSSSMKIHGSETIKKLQK